MTCQVRTLSPAESRVVAPGPRWMVVSGADAFVSWERARRGQDGPVDVLRRSLLSVASVTLLAELVDDRMLVPGRAASRCGEAPRGSRRSCWCDRWSFAQRNGGRLGSKRFTVTSTRPDPVHHEHGLVPPGRRHSRPGRNVRLPGRVLRPDRAARVCRHIAGVRPCRPGRTQSGVTGWFARRRPAP